jgi:hypothetical protein
MPRSHRWILLSSILLFIALIGACVDEPTAPESERESADTPSFAFMGPSGVDSVWHSGHFVGIQVLDSSSIVTQTELNAINAAAGVWNTYVFDIDASLPQLSEAATTSSVDKPRILINFIDDGEGAWCGSAPMTWYGPTIDSTRVVHLFRLDPDDECENPIARVVDDLQGVITHELSHHFDFLHLTTDETEFCAANVPDTGDLNPYPCTLEAQWIYRAYGLRPTYVAPDTLIVTELVISPVLDTMAVGDTVRYEVLAITGPEPSDGSGGRDTVSTHVSWTPENTSVIDVVSQTEARVDIEGVGSGTSDLVVRGSNGVDMAWPWPADTASVVVTSDACFDEEGTTAWRYSDQFLSAGCSLTGSNMRYKWRTTNAGSWTAYSADTLYEFSGHTSQGTDTVSLRVKNISTGDSATTQKPFVVQSGVVSVFGPTYVTDKSLKTYTSNTEGDWYERWNPDTYLSWGNAIVENDDTYTRIWPAGWYDVALRNDSTTDALRRRRHNIEVCYRCSPEFNVASASFSASVQATSLSDDWGVFGAGPWLSGGLTEITRYYDLAGHHEPRSPFASIAWLSDEGGTVANKAGIWSTTWSVDNTAGEGIKIVTFRVEPINRAAGYRFGFAVDPDVGDPTDDRSGYDSKRGLVYVTGGSDEKVVGLLLREKNSNALETVRQFGVLNMAPGTDEDARKIQESSGVQLTSDSEDVQLVLSTAEVAGTHEWQVVLLRAATVSELKSLADGLSELD